MLELILLLLLLFFGITTPVRVESNPEPVPMMMTPTPTPEIIFTDAQVFPVDVESAVAYFTSEVPARISLIVNGTLPTGCTDLDIETVEFQEGNTVFVNIGQVVVGAPNCPMMLVPYIETVQLEGTYPLGVTVIVNGIVANQDAAPAQAVNLMPIVVDAVTAVQTRSIPWDINITVTGSLPTGCEELPVEIQQYREGNAVYVSINQVVPEGQICTMMLIPYEETIRLDGQFDAPVTIIVNGVEVQS